MRKMKSLTFDRYALKAITGHKIEEAHIEGNDEDGHTIIIKLSGGLQLHIESDSEPFITLYGESQ